MNKDGSEVKAPDTGPSNLPRKELEKHSALCRPRGRKMKPGPCAKCGIEGPLTKGLCKRCYQHKRYVAQPGVAERIAERKARPAIEEKEKQVRSEKWRATHPGKKAKSKEGDQEYSQKESAAWVADWLKHQVENYLREEASHFDHNGIRLWAMTEEQIIGLCRIIYMAVNKHSSGRHELAVDKHQKKAWWDQGEGDGSYLDRPISPDLRGISK